jgi:HNH endonuclease
VAAYNQFIDALPGEPIAIGRDLVRLTGSIPAAILFSRLVTWCEGVGDHLQADHKSKSGPTTLANLQTLCCTCNQQKGAQT